ncbi:MAG: F0F1 ATP synthase subunit A [Rickettsiales bacterium]|nr:F0F1 ATP synthase subunit A [Rickettsiales bacterium]
MHISTDDKIIFQIGLFKLNQTLLFSWVVIFLLALVAFSVKFLARGKSANDKNVSWLQAAFEIILEQINLQLNGSSSARADLIFPFIGTLFLYILVSNLISLLPFCESPTASLSTTAALAVVVFSFATILGLVEHGLSYFKKYAKPSLPMIPSNIIGELSKMISLSIRLYGNVMSGYVINSILSEIVMLSVGFPLIINILSLISGAIQAYIFSMLSLMFI